MSNLPLIIPDQEIQLSHSANGIEFICHIRKTPTVLYGIFVEVVRQFYSTEMNLPRAVQGAVWNRDPVQSTMWIDTELRWEDDHPSVRPAIFAALSPITYTSLTGRADGLMGGDLAEAERTFSRSGSGTVQFIHIGQTDGEACVLGDATQDYLDAFGSVIRDDFCFTKFNLTSRVALARRAKESGERWGSTVDVAFEFQDTWTVKLESQKLKRFSFNAGQGIAAGGIV
jgi:hypothetical protein